MTHLVSSLSFIVGLIVSFIVVSLKKFKILTNPVSLVFIVSPFIQLSKLSFMTVKQGLEITSDSHQNIFLSIELLINSPRK